MSCDYKQCAPRWDGPWEQTFAWIPRRANEGWRWLVWLHQRSVYLGGHGSIREIIEYREAL